MNEEHDRVLKAFEDGGLNFTEKQKEIAGEAYDKVMTKYKCDWCGDKVNFIIHNLRKDEKMKFCDLCFWKFCKNMAKSYTVMQGAVKNIDRMMK